ncbi:MAG: thermonuclease family protein, partial [Candidatus Omnitrophica bacterium]|nr:thermonuclease family protein [Candidatus Omnitrophota bacterium]
GELYCYAMENSPLGTVIQAPLMIDCGFQIFKEMTYHKVGPLKSGDVVTSKKGSQGYSIRRCSDPDSLRFVYKAVLERVIDGETLICMIDTGFQNWTRQRLRLRHLDAPDLKTQRGRKAKVFIQEVLRDCSFLIVHTHKNDKNDRYLADIYYLPGSSHPLTVAASGRLLNQDLIEQGLAVPV